MKYQNGIIQTDRKPEIETVRFPGSRPDKVNRTFIIADKRFFVSEFCEQKNGYQILKTEPALVGFY